MAAEDPRNVPIFGDLHLYTAPLGTTLPTKLPTLAVLNLDPAFNKVGFTTPDGSSFVTDKTANPVRVHQSRSPVRFTQEDEAARLIVTLRDWNATAFRMAFGGGSFSAPDGDPIYDPPAAGEMENYSLVCDLFDGAYTARIVFPNAFTSSGINMPLAQNAPADKPTTFEALEPGGGLRPFRIIGNLPGFTDAVVSA